MNVLTHNDNVMHVRSVGRPRTSNAAAGKGDGSVGDDEVSWDLDVTVPIRTTIPRG